MSPTLTHFFEQYREAWNALDWKWIAEHYAVPSAIADRDGPHVYTTHEELVTKFRRGCQLLQERGFGSASFTVALDYQLGPDAVAVDLDWQIQAGSGPLAFRTLYVCHNTNAGWRIYAAHAYPGGT